MSNDFSVYFAIGEIEAIVRQSRHLTAEEMVYQVRLVLDELKTKHEKNQ